MTVFKKQSSFLIVLLCVVTMLCSCNKVDLTTTYRSQSSTQSSFSNQSFHTTINDNSFSTAITKAESSTTKSVVNNTEVSTAFTDSMLVTKSIMTDGMKKHTNNHKGIVLSVYAPETVVFGEKFYVFEKVTNNSSKSITYTLPYCTPNMHLEIETEISDSNNRNFIDCDTLGKELAHAGRSETLLPGESFEQTICFLPGWTDDGSRGLEHAKITMFDKGEYTGTAVFNWDTEEDIDSISLEFPVVVV